MAASATVPFLTLLGFGDNGWAGQFIAGTIVTVEVSVCSYLVGIVLGLIGAGGKLSSSRPIRFVSDLYTTGVRSVPELLLIILLFYTGTTLLNELVAATGNTGSIEISGFATAVVTLGFVQGAYMTEVFRGAILAVSPGLLEAARALALSPFHRFRLVTFPLMLRTALPGMGNLWQSVIKESALVSVVGFSELLTVGKNAAGETKYYLGFFLFTAAIYLSLTMISNVGFVYLERRLSRGFR
jgi:polar amino acid transport system permease protein